jgi:predicted lipoprotein with Yx(FWY)xxD motif
MAVPNVRTGPVVVGLVLVAFVAAACTSGAAPTSSPTASLSAVASVSATASPATASPAASSGGGRYGGGSPAAGSPATGSVVVNMATTTLGPVLTAANGLTLYVHAGDTATSSTCTGGCATAWPPLAVAAGGSATAGAGVTGTLGTLTRADGTTQVTYKGLPLYGWQNDTKPGDVTGQNIAGFTVAKP